MEKNKNHSEFCSSEENSFFQSLIRDSDISKEYGSGIYSILKTVKWLKFKSRNDKKNQMQGFYKNDERHPISYLAGNYKAFCFIVKNINKSLKRNNKPPIQLVGISKEEQIKEIKKLISILKKNSFKIFNENSLFFHRLMSNLGNSKIKGDKIESITFEKLLNKFGKDNIKIESSFGGQSDSLGLDGEITEGTLTYTIQIKPLSQYTIDDGKITIKTTGRIGSYTQDLMVFSNQKETLIILNKNTEYSNTSYIFPKDNLIYKLT